MGPPRFASVKTTVMTCQGSSNLAEPNLAAKRENARLAALLFECYFAVEYFYVIFESQFSYKKERKQTSCITKMKTCSLFGNPCDLIDWLIIKTLIEVDILDVICVVRAMVVVV